MAGTKTERRDIYSEVTASIVGALETAGEHSRPWVMLGGGASAPRNVDGRHYRGVNTLLLWASAMESGYSSGVWGTYRAWQAQGAQVRKGEKGTLVTLWKPFDRKANADEVTAGKADDDGKVGSLLLRHFSVFAAEQVDGWEPPAEVELDPIERDAAADGFFARIGADVTYGGDRAGYLSEADRIVCPLAEQFVDGEHFYAVLGHEHGHWTGHRSRLDRDLTGRFGDESYAAEELVAELTAAFVCARLGFAPVVRDDHASYVKSWLKALRNDDRAIFTAASKAQQACDYLVTSGVDPAAVEIPASVVGDPTEEITA